MRLKIDRESDTFYLRLDERTVVESEEVRPGIPLDFDAHGEVVGIEMLDISKRIVAEQLRVIQVETT
jgi:uncharacterized protein YuzE